MAISLQNIFNTEGILLPTDAFVVIVRTAWNALVVDELEKGCVQELEKHNVKYDVLTVPGAVEIPFIINHYWKNRRQPHAFITLGCVTRGGTPHFDYVCRSITDGVLQLNLSLPVPVIFGVLTVDNELQAIERIGGKHGHKGVESAAAALQMISLAKKIANTI